LEARYEQVNGGSTEPLIRLPLSRFIAFTYSTIAENLPDDKLREVNNLLFRDPKLQTTLIPGIPIPAWMDMADIPKESIVEYDDATGETVPVVPSDPRVSEYLAMVPPPAPES
jgi:hypothetical protein